MGSSLQVSSDRAWSCTGPSPQWIHIHSLERTTSSMRSKDFVRHMRLVLRIIAFGVWVNVVYNYVDKSLQEAKKPSTREVVEVDQELNFPTVLVCNTMQRAHSPCRAQCDCAQLQVMGQRCQELYGQCHCYQKGWSQNFEPKGAWQRIRALHGRNEPLVLCSSGRRRQILQHYRAGSQMAQTGWF